KTREQSRPFVSRGKRAVKQTPIQWQRYDNHSRGSIDRQSIGKIMGHDGACPSICLEGAALSAPTRIVNQQQTERDRQQIEEAIVASRRDDELKKNEETAGQQSRSSGRPNEKGDHDFHDQAKCDREFFEPFGMLIRP